MLYDQMRCERRGKSARVAGEGKAPRLTLDQSPDAVANNPPTGEIATEMTAGEGRTIGEGR